LPFQVSAPIHHAAQWQAELNAGAQLFTTRMGRMNLACTHCHDVNIGKQMRADVISPAHPTGFPIFKMSWQSMGSIDRRLRACFSGVQAEVPAAGSVDLRRLELFLKSRAQGLPLDGPSLRR
jgi:sulfur-oxidizing protein SoxA